MNGTPVVIRADAWPKIGTGHVMRCIALAQEFQNHGARVTFISHCECSDLRQRIINEGFHIIFVENPHPDPSDLNQVLSFNSKISSLPNVNKQMDQCWLVLDGYHFTPVYQKSIRDKGYFLLVIDDMNHLSHYHADILLNQNIHAFDLDYCCDEDTTLLLGPSYVLLRNEFQNYETFKRQIPDTAKKILVTFGGSNPDNVYLKIIEVLKRLAELDISVKIVLGHANIHQEAIYNALTCTKFDAELLVNPPNIPELMAWADMAICAAGSTCWEMAFMGVPIIVFILAENQMAVAEGISKEGVGVNLGWYSDFDEETARNEIKALIQSKTRRLKMSQQGQVLIKALGRSRVRKKVTAKSISIRPVKETDCELIWCWANDQAVRKSAFYQDIIPFEDHKKWFNLKIKDGENNQFIASDGSNHPVGQIRFDKINDREYEVDISIDKYFRRSGYGSELIKRAIRQLLEYNSVDVIHAHVKFDNSASKEAFIRAGFIREKDIIIKKTECLHLVWQRKNEKY